MFNIFKNTIEGVAQAAINTVKFPIGMAILPLDGGKTVSDSVKGIKKGLEKVGNDD